MAGTVDGPLGPHEEILITMKAAPRENLPREGSYITGKVASRGKLPHDYNYLTRKVTSPGSCLMGNVASR